VPSSENEREMGKHPDYELGRPHPGKVGKEKTPCFPEGGALIQEKWEKRKTLGNRVGAPPLAKLEK